MMMGKTFTALASLGLLVLLPFAPSEAAVPLRPDSGAVGDDPNKGDKAAVIESIGGGGGGVAAEALTPRLLDTTIASTPEGEKAEVAELAGGGGVVNLDDANHPGLRGLLKPDCNTKPTSPQPKPTNPGPIPKGKGGPPPSPKVSKAKTKAKSKGPGKGKGQVESKGSVKGGPKTKTGKGSCGGSGCSSSKSKQPGKSKSKSKGKVKDAKKTAKGPKGSKGSTKCAKTPKTGAKSAKGPKSSKGGCTGCPKPSPPKPTKPTVKCTGEPATTAPTANVELPPDDTCERQCMQWVSQNCVVLDELGSIMENHCVVPFPFDDDLFGRSLASAAGEAAGVSPVTSKPSTVQEKIDYHRRMAHVYQQVLSLID